MKAFARNVIAVTVVSFASPGCADPHRDLFMSSEGVTELFTPALLGSQHDCVAINVTPETRQIFVELFNGDGTWAGYRTSVTTAPGTVASVPTGSITAVPVLRYCKISVDGPASMVRAALTARRLSDGRIVELVIAAQ